jgi:hypothetical protein
MLWDDLDPRTRDSILIQRCERPDWPSNLYGCGCERRTPSGRVWMCAYHQGYDDALDGLPPDAGHGRDLKGTR